MEDPRSKTVQVYCVATADTKLDELRFLSESVHSNIKYFSSPASQFQVQVTIIDVSVGPKETEKAEGFSFIPRKDVLSFYLESAKQDQIPIRNDRGKAISAMGNCLTHFLKKSSDTHVVGGVIGLGGRGGTSLSSTAFKMLPIGVPKMIVSTVASGNIESYIGTSDLVLFPSVVDICGLNNVSKVVFSNAGAAFAGMIIGSLEQLKAPAMCDEKPTVGITMFGVTTPCVSAIRKRLEDMRLLLFMLLELVVEQWKICLLEDLYRGC